MRAAFDVTSRHWNDADGNPGGGVSCGRWFTISWQDGPLGQHSEECLEPTGPIGEFSCKHESCTRREPNGAVAEDVIAAVIGRIEFYQGSPFACSANENALGHLYRALRVLDARPRERNERAVEGTHAV